MKSGVARQVQHYTTLNMLADKMTGTILKHFKFPRKTLGNYRPRIDNREFKIVAQK